MGDLQPVWADTVTRDQQDQAQRYLTLFCGPVAARRTARRFADAPLVQQRAKDLLRASRSKPLDKKDDGVGQELDKIDAGERLGAVLVVWGRRPVIAEGYRRVCAQCLIDPDGLVPCAVVAPEPDDALTPR